MDLTAEPDSESPPDLDRELAAAAAEERSAHALALRFERDQLIRSAAEKAIERMQGRFRTCRKAAKQARCDLGAWRAGRDDAAKLSTGRTLA